MVSARNITVGYEEKVVLHEVDAQIYANEIVAILGPNGCGKSTLMKSFSRLLPISHGVVELSDVNINDLKTKEVAQTLALLSQQNLAPMGITVEDLVYYGRNPHKKWLEPFNKEDEEVVTWAIESTGLLEYRDRIVSSLSGGERQRVWLAMALAQKPKVLILDEPTTYLDICHQLELLELVKEIKEKYKMTVIMVLHDLNQALRYSDRVIVMSKGEVVVTGKPEEVINQEMIREVFGVESKIGYDEVCNKPYIYPIAVSHKNKEVLQ